MRVSYLIAWHHGCRFSETHLHLPTQVDIERGIIRFRTKAHKGHLAEFPLAPQLVPMFAGMIAEGRTWSFDMPRYTSKPWHAFFRKIGLPHLCFHSTRVSFVTRCHEAGIPKDMVMRIVGHASSVVHDIYPRLAADSGRLRDLRGLLG
jgi:integrase